MVKGDHLRVRLGLVCIVFIIVPLACGLEAQIKKIIFNDNGFGTYSFEYETSDGTYRREDGGVISSPNGQSGLVVRGEYRYIDPNGQLHSMKYVADKSGFHAKINDDYTRFNDRRII